MARTRIELNDAGVQELLNDPGLGDFLLDLANRVAEAAQASAPVATGEYRDSIVADLETTDRVVGVVRAESDHAWVVEAKTGNLARALDAAGGG